MARPRPRTLLGHEMAGPVDIFVYDAREDFFGALGPGAREWSGAATFPELRTIFMWLGAGPASYLETTVVHEVTHVVFQDATETRSTSRPSGSTRAWRPGRSSARPMRSSATVESEAAEAACSRSTRSRMTSRLARAGRPVVRNGHDHGRHDHRPLRRGRDRADRRGLPSRRLRRRGAGGRDRRAGRSAVRRLLRLVRRR